MAKICTDTNAMNRSGTSQVQRVMKALLPVSAKTDERDIADLLLFAKRYAAFLNFYNDKNVPDGDWQPLMSMDVSITLAAISKTGVDTYIAYLKNIYHHINTAADEATRKKYFKSIFDFIFSTVIELDKYYKEIPEDFEFRAYFSSTIQSKLQEPLNRLLFYYNQFIADGYINAAGTFIPVDPPVVITLAQNFSLSQLSTPWSPSMPVATTSLTVPDPTDISNSIYHVIYHNIFNAQVDIFFKTLSNLVLQSAGFLDKTLTAFPKHTPHHALFISFLHLFKMAQQQLNQFGARHLDFYYQQVLRLTTKNALPDSVHLVVELQKGLVQHLVKQGTVFKAGKYADGKEISFAADEETVINKAVVKSLQSIYLKEFTKSGKAQEAICASPMADSEDGQGAKLLNANNGWFAFGNPDDLTTAVIGCLIASHYLYLNEGTRTILVKFVFAEAFSLNAADINNAFHIQLTGKKGWHDVPAYNSFINAGEKSIHLTIVLQGDAPAIIGYSQKIHQSNYNTALPLMRLMMKNEIGTANPYIQLKALPLQKIIIDVAVAGLKNVVIQNDEGALDPSKTFTPFGSQPKVGSSFIVGNKEIFQKKLAGLSFVIDWDDVPDKLLDQLDEALHEYERTLSYIDVKQKFHSVKTAVLNKGKWTQLDKQKGMFIEDNLYDIIFNWSRPESKYAGKLSAADIENAVINISPVNIQPNAQNFDKNEAYTNTTIDGFIKLELNTPDFGHSAYPEALRKAAQKITVAVTGAGTANMTMSVTPASTVPQQPYTPAIKNFSVNYRAVTEINFQHNAAPGLADSEGSFYHLVPFGYTPVNKTLQSLTTMLPLYENQGELYIGFENLLHSSTLKVLFQLADGSANPLKMATTVKWYYLSANKWIAFDKIAVTDATNNFSSSGVVVFVLNEMINTGNTLLNPQLSWIKAVVKTDTDAVCKLIAVQAQVITATLQTDDVNEVYFKKFIPPNTISKLLIADAAVKKIGQPFGSFGGRVKEPQEQFYTRVSERLRHKQRAITAWDFERLVLEQFPEVYKVKCINHTGIVPAKAAGSSQYSETVPGHVTIVTIPDIRNNTHKNILKPYTSIGLLTNIKIYLARHTSPFVKLYVLNPKFEELQFQFDVKMMPTLDETFYTKQLSLDIERFLCPWAYEGAGDIDFGGKITKSVVLNFIEERPYVDYVTCFRMHHFIDRGTAGNKAYYDVEEAITSTGISILVAYFDEPTHTRHLINAGVPCPC